MLGLLKQNIIVQLEKIQLSEYKIYIKINLEIMPNKEEHFKNQAYRNFFRDMFIRLIKCYCQLDLLLSIWKY